jgi:hypothetical protein
MNYETMLSAVDVRTQEILKSYERIARAYQRAIGLGKRRTYVTPQAGTTNQILMTSRNFPYSSTSFVWP